MFLFLYFVFNQSDEKRDDQTDLADVRTRNSSQMCTINQTIKHNAGKPTQMEMALQYIS